MEEFKCVCGLQNKMWMRIPHKNIEKCVNSLKEYNESLKNEIRTEKEKQKTLMGVIQMIIREFKEE